MKQDAQRDAASLPEAAVAREPALQAVAERFPGDLQVAAGTADKLRVGPPTPLRPEQEPWPPMRMPP